ncbi:hypothetical protein [Novosphingobium sp.]|uniref:hypothetical protein n=1 Tax=Novosphingobium sp. TaxID=1874826 RepID=UPI002FDD6091
MTAESQLIQIVGSHGALIVHRASGHIVDRLDPCDCEDCGGSSYAESIAVSRLCEAWGKSCTFLWELGDAASVTEYGPHDYARDEAPAMLEAIRDAVGASDANDGDSLMNAIEAFRAIISRIDDFPCEACGRPEHACSADPCSDVLADRHA